MGERKDILSLSNGEVTLTWPTEMTEEDIGDICAWLKLRLKIFSRSLAPHFNIRETYMDKIREFFNSRENKWASIVEIQKMLNTKEHAVRQVVYNTRPNDFERIPDPEGSRKTLFRLRVTNDQKD